MNQEKYTRNSTETHSYNVNVASDVGVNSAVLFSNILHWVRVNRANGRNHRDGKFWTYNSCKAWAELFPEFSEVQVKHALKKLKDKGYIVTGDYNENRYDHTLWYSLSDEAEALFLDAQSNSEKNSIDQTNLSNREVKKRQSTNTDINTDKKPDINSLGLHPEEEEKEKVSKEELNRLVDAYHDLCPKMSKLRKLSDKRASSLRARLKEYSEEEVKTVFELAGKSAFLNGSNNRGWKADFDWLLNPNNFLKVIEGRYQVSDQITPTIGSIRQETRTLEKPEDLFG